MKEEILKKDIIQKEIIQIKYCVNKNFNPMLKRVSKLLLQIGYKESSVRVYEIEKSLNVKWCIAENKNRRCTVFENSNHRIVITREMIVIYTKAPEKHLEDYISAFKFITHRILENDATTIQQAKFEIQTLDYVHSSKDIEEKYNYLSTNKDIQLFCITEEDSVLKSSRIENEYSDKEIIEYTDQKQTVVYKMAKFKIDRYNGVELGNVITNISASFLEEINERVLNNRISINANELKEICYKVLKSILKEKYSNEIDV